MSTETAPGEEGSCLPSPETGHFHSFSDSLGQGEWTPERGSTATRPRTGEQGGCRMGDVEGPDFVS